jgi:hypothetical protein
MSNPEVQKYDRFIALFDGCLTTNPFHASTYTKVELGDTMNPFSKSRRIENMLNVFSSLKFIPFLSPLGGEIKVEIGINGKQLKGL